MKPFFNLERHSMIKKILLAGCAFALLGCATSWATNVNLALTVDQAAKTWTVKATLSDAQSLGLGSFSVDVQGTGGISILRATPAAQTNKSPTEFNSLRSGGIVSGTNVTGIAGGQDAIGAVNNQDDSVLKYGYALPTNATGQFVGPVTGLGEITLASGPYTGTGGAITVVPTPATFFTMFPTTWDANATPPGSSQSQIAATTVVPATVNIVPEPASIILMGLAGLGIVVGARRRHS